MPPERSKSPRDTTVERNRNWLVCRKCLAAWPPNDVAVDNVHFSGLDDGPWERCDGELIELAPAAVGEVSEPSPTRAQSIDLCRHLSDGPCGDPDCLSCSANVLRGLGIEQRRAVLGMLSHFASALEFRRYLQRVWA